MSLKEYKPGRPFPGTIGRTWEQSSPAWPAPLRSKPGAPNVLFIVLDDTGFGHLGCYGSPIRTPNLDRLAKGGLLYNNMHTTALCSPTRSCILTGRNHHSNGMATITETSLGYPGYNGTIPFENGLLSEMLMEAGYNTYAIGKWHLAPAEQTSAAGPYSRWPLGRGFERFYGFLGGDTHQYYPDLIHDNHAIRAPATPEEGYHLTPDLVEKAIDCIADTKQVAPDKPFFLYFATGAMHAPHHVPKEWADRYKGQFDDGWDAYRQKVFQKQLELGVLPKGTQLSRHDPDVQDWEALPPEEKRLYARMMEVFAGFLEHTDHHIGRLLKFLEDTGQLDNTLIMVLSDNGASAEGGPHGSVNELKFFNNTPESLEQNMAAIDELGGPKYFNHYPWGWAWAGDTPFRRWKREVYRGGTTDPFLVHWPKGIQAKGEVRAQYAHAIDMVPTVLDCLGLEPLAEIRGVTQSPLEGVSFKHTFNDANAESHHHTQYFEMFSNRALYHDGWRAVCPFPGPSFTEAGEGFGESTLTEDRLRELDAQGWELYRVSEDASETKNVAQEHRGKLIEMIALWYAEAGRYQVLPLASPTRAVFAQERPQITQDRKRYVYRPRTSPTPENAAVHVLNRPHTITAEVDLSGEAEGVLLCHGGLTGGYTFFVQDGKLHYVYNFVGEQEFHIESAVDVPLGRSELKFSFEPTGKPDLKAGRGAPGRGRLYINDDLVAQSDISATMPLILSLGEGLTCGRDESSSVSKLYAAPFEFTGTLFQVTVDVSGKHLRDAKSEQKVAMAKQ
ncbi:arylsulfatase [Corallococcus sp. CA047B]|uniref:arylsulfatase n=1 Tax=Corallococcus sp. CA047B TaxID=2316729 RepID=UPI000EA101A0|nr:arylsulfatase [Corallococcus sp. CA047B]RKH10339.1 arylsulfatase [Corallococcus sp. CA047B]